MSDIDVVFINQKNGQIIPDLPTQFPEEKIRVGKKILSHYFLGGWKTYRIKRIADDNPKKVFVKKVLIHLVLFSFLKKLFLKSLNS